MTNFLPKREVLFIYHKCTIKFSSRIYDKFLEFQLPPSREAVYKSSTQVAKTDDFTQRTLIITNAVSLSHSSSLPLPAS